jgi:internalin A
LTFTFSDISPLKELKSLTRVNLSNNEISEVFSLRELKSLTKLNLSHNQIVDIRVLEELESLTKLNLGYNSISDISALKNLKRLEQLDITSNQIKQLPFQLIERGLDIKWGDYYYFDAEEKGICLKGNPLEVPPIEILKQGTEATRNYFKEVENMKVRLLECKLLIVGNGEVGKTTLMKKLKDNNFIIEVGKEEITHGINIVPWDLQCYFEDGNSGIVKIHFWDFGGQDIYHATHQFFLTKRSLYLFVWDARKDEETRIFDYWFNIIKLLSDNSPVICVMNKSDLRIKHIDEASFIEKFKNIANFLQVSCVTGDGIQELTGQIRTSLSSMAHLRDKLPKVWMDIRDHLKKEGKNYISLETYFDICKIYGLNEERAEFLSGYLHDLGVILHYRHDKLLENTVILNPEWTTEAVYTLLDTRKIQENKGRFKFQYLKKYWDLTKFPREKHAQLVRLMEKFELCFPIIGTEIHIVPELLPAKRPGIDFGKYEKAGNLHFQYHYEFMPEGIITRFISRMYYLIKEDHFWKNGVELRFEDSTAFVLSELLNRRIKISVIGSCKSELLAIIRNDFEHIHHTLNMEKDTHYDEMIPCTCGTCLEFEKPHLFKYETIKKFSVKGLHTTHCPTSVEEVAIEKLLKGFESPKPKKDLLEILITTTHQLQGISKTIKPDEDSRNSFIALLLSIHGFYVKDQTRWGRSETGKTMGYIDIKIENLENEAEAVIEAFILKGFDRNVIDSHLTKLFGYDPSGLVRNFIIVYSEAPDFLALWKKYLNHLPKIDFKYPLTGKVQEGDIKFTDIKSARTRHLREGKEVYVYYLFVNMKQ